MNTKDFNDSLSPLVKGVLVDFDTFKKYNDVDRVPVNSDEVAASIEKVTERGDSMEFLFKTKKRIIAYYEGRYQKFDVNGRMRSDQQIRKETNKGHFVLSIEGFRLTLERLIAIGSDILNNTMPISYEGWEANVKDGSGSTTGMNKYNTTANFSPANLEWCLGSDNVRHRWALQRIWDKTGCLYELSALDMDTIQMAALKDGEALRKYCDSKLRLVSTREGYNLQPWFFQSDDFGYGDCIFGS